MAAESLAALFARAYRGRHRPEDALWWLDHPGEPGPSSASPVQELFLEAVDELERAGDHGSAAALMEALAQLLHVDRRKALDALMEAEARHGEAAGDRPSPDADLGCDRCRPER